MEAWVNVVRSTDPNTKWGNMYYGTVATIPYGVTFIDNPMVNVIIRNGSLWLACSYPNKSETGTMYAIRPSDTTMSTTTSWVSVYAVGRWK